jgi:hypothetical protein
MLRALGERASDRKLRLFGCACCRRIWDWLPDAKSQAVVEVSERYADGVASEGELMAAMLAAWDSGPQSLGVAKTSAWYAARAGMEDALNLTGAEATGAPRWPASRYPRERERGFQAALFRDIFRNPFDPPPSLAQSLLDWNDGTVVRLASAIYEERAFDHLPILADALEEAGCTDPDILLHGRARSDHARGCWLLDLIIGKR